MNTPEGFTCIGFKTLFNNEPFNPKTALEGLPLYDVLHFVLERQNAVQYTLGSRDDQMIYIEELQEHLRFTPKYRLKIAKAKFPNLYLFGNMATLLFIMMATEFCDSRSRELTEKEIEKVLKAYLYCNDFWSDRQASGISPLVIKRNLPGMYLMADIPIMEFKFHKDFKPQLFKAGQLFKFMENNEPYLTYLRMFYKEYGITDWREYIGLLFSFYSSAIDKCVVKIDDQYSNIRPFFDRMCVDLESNEGHHLWSSMNIMYLREHPLLSVLGEYYIALNPNLIVDRMFQALKYIIFDAMLANGARNNKGKLLTDRPTFFGMLGNDFSETNIFYAAIKKAFSGIADAMFSGEELKQKGVVAEPDFYIRFGDSLLLFEYKDVTLSDEVKQSYDYDVVKGAILDRICKDDGKVRKGVGQLLYSANEILTNKSLLSIDSGSLNVTRIYPIVVITDKSFNSLGVQHLVVEASSTLLQKYSIPGFVSPPIIMDYDGLLLMSKKINDGRINIISLLDEFNANNNYNLSSFDAHITDNHRDWLQMEKEDIDHIFAEIIQDMDGK